MRASRWLVVVGLFAYLVGIGYTLVGGRIVAYFTYRDAQKDLERFDLASANKNLQACLKYRLHDVAGSEHDAIEPLLLGRKIADRARRDT